MRVMVLCLFLIGCSSSEPEPQGGSLNEPFCKDGGRAFKVGATWDCSDGCNKCKCVGQDLIESTTMACVDSAPPFAVDTAVPADTFTPAKDTAVSDSPAG